GFVGGLADGLQFAIDALGLARNAQSASMPNHAMREVDPLVTRDHPHQILLNLAGFDLCTEFEAAGDAIDMRVHDHTFSFAKPGTEDDVGGFASRSGYGEKLLHFVGHLPTKLVNDFLPRTDNRLGFVTKESSRANFRLKFFRLEGRKVLWRRIFLEETGRDHVYAYIGTLR